MGNELIPGNEVFSSIFYSMVGFDGAWGEGVAERRRTNLFRDRYNNLLICFNNKFSFLDMTKPAKTFKDLVVWQKAHRFVLAIYALTADFPRSEIYCLTSQMRRAAISIPANIAEGFKKRGTSDKTRFFNIAQGSLEECRYYLILVQDLGYGTTANIEAVLEEVSKLLIAYASAIESNH
jgi:four helix bundle protein